MILAAMVPGVSPMRKPAGVRVPGSVRGPDQSPGIKASLFWTAPGHGKGQLSGDVPGPGVQASRSISALATATLEKENEHAQILKRGPPQRHPKNQSLIFLF